MESVAIPSIITSALIVVTIIFPLLASAFVALRFHARNISKMGSQADDWTVLAALFLTWIMSINVWISGGLLGVNHFKGSDPIKAAELSIRTTWIDGFFLGVALALTKISILLFYKRIFVMRWFRWICWVLIAVVVCWGTSTVFTQLFMATPITDAWNVTVNHYNIDFDSFYLAVAGMSLGFDVIVLCLPLFLISRLQMPITRKIYVMLIFWLGAFCCVSAAIRFYYLYNEIFRETEGNGDSQFAVITTGFLWAKVECACSIIAACLPNFGPLFRDNRSFFSSLRSFRNYLSLGSTKEERNVVDADFTENLTGNNNHGVELTSRSWASKSQEYGNLERGDVKYENSGEILVSKSLTQQVTEQ